MKTLAKAIEIVENRVRNFSRMKAASKNIDRIRKKAPAGWNSVDIIRRLRQIHR